MRRNLLAVFLLLLTAAPAFAQQAAQSFLAGAPEETRTAIARDMRGRQALYALDHLLAAPTIDRDLLGAAVKNPHFAPYVADTLIDLDRVKAVPGVERVLDRIARANDDSGPRGASFEISVGARLYDRLAELSANVHGYEVDARLKDGTLVEVKYIQGHHQNALMNKAIDQLKLRGAAQHAPVMIVVNRQLHPETLWKIHNALDGTGGMNASIFEANRSGMIRPQVAKPMAPMTPGH